MGENYCNSRGFSRIMKSCFPNPQQDIHQHHHLIIKSSIRNNNNRLESDEKSSSSSSSSMFLISILPDDLLLECLSRVPSSSLSSVSLVCRKWFQMLNSKSYFDLRRVHGHIRRKVYAFSVTDYGVYAANHCVDGDQIEEGGGEGEGEDSTSGWSLSSPFSASGFLTQSSFSHARVVSIGKVIYIINRDVTLGYDTWMGVITVKSPMLYPRKKFATANVNGKIYISGGAARNEVVEEYEPETDTWSVVSEAPRRRYGCIGAAVDGVFYVIGGLKIGGGGGKNEMVTRGGCSEAHLYASSMDLFDVQSKVWLRSRTVPGGGCVVAACAAGGYVYILASHAVELSFWRFDGRRKRGGGGGGGGFGEWCRMQSPPLPAQVRLDSSVRFSCVGIGGENYREDSSCNKVVLVQVLGCIDDLLRRSGRSCRGMKEGLVLVYDGNAEEWSRGVDLPEVIRRASCVSVEC